MKYQTTPSDMSKYMYIIMTVIGLFILVISTHNKIRNSAGFICLSYREGFQKITARPFLSFIERQKKC